MYHQRNGRFVNLYTCLGERSGSVVECLTRDRGAAGSSLTGVTALWSLSNHIYHSLVLVQPRKTRPCVTERLLMGRKESTQTNKYTCIVFTSKPSSRYISLYFCKCFPFASSQLNSRTRGRTESDSLL